MLNPVPPILAAAEFSRLRFFIEFQEAVSAGESVFLRLRRDLRQAAREVLGRGEDFDRLFEPQVADDPLARRRFQRPGPPFVILMPESIPKRLVSGDVLALPIVFWGQGRHGIADFIEVMQAFGESGIHRKEGRFGLLKVETEDAGGSGIEIWRPGSNVSHLAPPVLDARWWLETSLSANAAELYLQVRTPARLIADGRPLFKADFCRLFPFILRRVTSMLYAHCGIEVIDNPQALIARAAQVSEEKNDLRWRDWRVIEGERCRQELGGLTGSLHLRGEALDDLYWILGLGTLMNCGKGATFAAGGYTLHPF